MDKIVVEAVFDVSSEKVWEAITNPEIMKIWYFDISNFKLEQGNVFTFYESGGNAYFHQCELLSFEQGKLLQHTWTHPQQSKGSSVVAWKIEPQGDEKTKVTLTHEGVESFADAGPNFSQANFEMGWNAIVKTSLRNYLYGIKKLKFEVSINAGAAHIWNLMWSKKTYTDWVEPFCAGTYFTGEVELGNRIHFMAPSGSGMFSDVFYLVPEKIVLFKHLGNIENGQEMPLDAETQKWTGSFEMYKLHEAEGTTTVTAEIDCVPEYLDYMNEKFPLALQKLKELSEK